MKTRFVILLLLFSSVGLSLFAQGTITTKTPLNWEPSGNINLKMDPNYNYPYQYYNINFSDRDYRLVWGIGYKNSTESTKIFSVNGIGDIFLGRGYGSRVYLDTDLFWEANLKTNLSDRFGSKSGSYQNHFDTSDGKYFWSVSDEAHGDMLSVRNNGRVGIGTNTPAAKFHVIGDSKFEGPSGFLGKTNFQDNVEFVKNVGIGTNSPEMPLHVIGNAKIEGDIFAKRISLDLGSFPDYVFNDNYNLRPLEQVEKFIVQNKHLPGVAPEKEMVKNGMNVGEMNKILMEKIEELTLYTIQQQKLINNLNDKVDNLEKQLQ
ncbi:MAG: hypothetical protein ACEPOW_12330 [Bacteroidales bacterium]